MRYVCRWYLKIHLDKFQYITQKESIPSEEVQVIKESLAYIQSLSAEKANGYLKTYGKILFKYLPQETTELLKQLCTGQHQHNYIQQRRQLQALKPNSTSTYSSAAASEEMNNAKFSLPQSFQQHLHSLKSNFHNKLNLKATLQQHSAQLFSSKADKEAAFPSDSWFNEDEELIDPQFCTNPADFIHLFVELPILFQQFLEYILSHEHIDTKALQNATLIGNTYLELILKYDAATKTDAMKAHAKDAHEAKDINEANEDKDIDDANEDEDGEDSGVEDADVDSLGHSSGLTQETALFQSSEMKEWVINEDKEDKFLRILEDSRIQYDDDYALLLAQVSHSFMAIPSVMEGGVNMA